jgi:hypothetical protein
MLKIQLPHKYPPIRIWTRFTSARDVPAPPKRKTNPSVIVNVLLISFMTPHAPGARFASMISILRRSLTCNPACRTL